MYEQYCRVKDIKRILCNFCYVSLNKVPHARLVTHIYLIIGEYHRNETNKSSLESVRTCMTHVSVQGDMVGDFKAWHQVIQITLTYIYFKMCMSVNYHL